MGEIADDHMVDISWSDGTGIGERDGRFGPMDHPSFGGIDAYIRRNAHVPNYYRCKFCGESIVFLHRRPYNKSDGVIHTCLADANKARIKEKK